MQVLVGARIFDGERFLEDRAVVIEGRRMVALAPYSDRPRGGDERDLGGGLLAPGFIDSPTQWRRRRVDERRSERRDGRSDRCGASAFRNDRFDANFGD